MDNEDNHLFFRIIFIKGGDTVVWFKKPGMDNQGPGENIEVGPGGGKLDKPREVTIGKVTDYLQRKSPGINGKRNNNKTI